MRSLFEIHYDDVHLQRWREREGKAPQRKGAASDHAVWVGQPPAAVRGRRRV